MDGLGVHSGKLAGFRTIIVAVVLLTGVTIPLTSISGQCHADLIVEQLRNSVDGLENYSLRTHSWTEEFSANSEISGDRYRRLSVKSDFSSGALQWSVQTVFDGRKQWLEERHGDSFQVLMVRLEEVVNERRPFDTGLYVWGTGLLSGEDYPGTVAALLSIYEYSAACDDNVATLSGNVDEDGLAAYASARNVSLSSYQGFIDNFPHARLTVDVAKSTVIHYMLGKTDAPDSFEVEFYDIEFDAIFDQNTFRYVRPPYIETVDVTDRMRR